MTLIPDFAPLRVLALDLHALLAPPLVDVLAAAQIDLLGISTDSDDAIARCALHPPDALLLLTDWRAAAATFGLITAVHRRAPQTPLVVVATTSRPLYLITCFLAGARGYALCDGLADLAEVLRVARRGGCACCAASRAAVTAASGPLSPRERVIAAHIAAGRTTAEIAALMGVKASTVETHIKRMLQKIGGRTRLEIAMWWMYHVELTGALPGNEGEADGACGAAEPRFT